MSLIRIVFAAALLGTIGLLGQGIRASLAETPPEFDVPPEPRALVDVTHHEVQSGETFGGIMAKHGISGVPSLLQAARPFFDLSRIRVGRTLVIRRLKATMAPLSVRYPLDEDSTLVLWPAAAGATADVETVTYDRAITRRIISVESTLWEAAMAAGLRPGDIVRLSRIFQWEVDFNTELRAGARVILVADELLSHGEAVRLDDYHAVRLENDGRAYTALRHVDAKGQADWYGPDGEATKRPFLRSPLEFSRVTSSFTRKRFHPVLKRNRAHLGTDFGAPRGTPIRSVGDGVVVHAGTSGGYGKLVKISHPGPYGTRYAHMSRIKVKRGQRIKQGQIIGTVGSTGLATGPHLHYEFLKNGRQVNPMTVKLPTTRPLPRSERAAFAQTRALWLPQLADEPGVAEAPEPANE